MWPTASSRTIRMARFCRVGNFLGSGGERGVRVGGIFIWCGGLLPLALRIKFAGRALRRRVRPSRRLAGYRRPNMACCPAHPLLPFLHVGLFCLSPFIRSTGTISVSAQGTSLETHRPVRSKLFHHNPGWWPAVCVRASYGSPLGRDITHHSANPGFL